MIESLQCPDCLFTREIDHDAIDGHSESCLGRAAFAAQLAMDREWFENHPDATEYYRQLVPGDFGVSNIDGVVFFKGPPKRICVFAVASGVRFRRFPENMIIKVDSVTGRYILETFQIPLPTFSDQFDDLNDCTPWKPA